MLRQLFVPRMFWWVLLHLAQTLRDRENAAMSSPQVFLARHPQRGTWFLCLMPCMPVDRAQRDVQGSLVPLPLMGIPFECVVTDLVGPLEKSVSRFWYILVNVDYVTQYPGAIPLHTMKAPTIVGKLMKVFTRDRIPREILMDRGSNFLSQLMK